jgi:hypothetical protein
LGGVDGVVRQSRQRSPDDSIGAVLQRLKGKTPEQELHDATSPMHLGGGSEAVVELTEWATSHPLLDASHCKGERSWQCMGLKVLTIKPIQGRGIAIRAGIHYSSPSQAPRPVTLTRGQKLDPRRPCPAEATGQAGS